jgi:hypothetical protein
LLSQISVGGGAKSDTAWLTRVQNPAVLLLWAGTPNSLRDGGVTVMRVIARSLWVGLLALLGAVVLATSWTMTTAVQLQATTALIMSGTFNPDPSPGYIADVTQRYLDPFGDLAYDPPPVGVHTPEEFFPIFGTRTFDQSVAQGVLDLQDAIDANTPNAGDRVIILGYSQSARIATVAKRNFIENYDPADPDATPIAGFVLLSDPNKPNGGILQRYKFFGTIPFFGITFDGAAPTNGPQNLDGSYVAPTKDITFIHDAISDHPVWVLNGLAMANTLAGYFYLHGETPMAQDPDLIYQGSAGDTDYYVIDNDILPILRPLGSLGVPHFVLSALDEPFRVMVETAYRRDLGPGVPVQASLLPAVNPIALAINLIRSIPVGIDNALEELGVGRKLGTTPSGPYGVGGPPLPAPPATTDSALSASTEGVAPEVDSDVEPQVDSGEPSVEPAATEAVTRDKDEDAETAVTKPEPPSKPEPPAKSDPPAKKTTTESPSSPSGQQPTDSETPAADPQQASASDSESSAESENMDAA